MSKQKKIPAVLLDFAGKAIKFGDIVVYGKALGRCAGINAGIVLETYQSKGEYDSYPYDRIKLLTNQDSWEDFAKRNIKSRKYGDKTNPMKEVTLKFSDRLIVIAPENLGDSELAHFFRMESIRLKGQHLFKNE